MFKRFFSMVGLAARTAGLKASLLVFAAKRSAISMLGYLVAAVVALGGLAVLLGAGCVALAEIVGVPIALAAVGVFLLLMASVIWLIANRRGRGTDEGEAMTEHEARENAARSEEQLLSMLGITNNDNKLHLNGAGPHMPSSPQYDTTKGLDDPKVVMAAGVALLGLLGPGRIFKTIRIATALASIAAVANRALNEQQDKQVTQRAP